MVALGLFPRLDGPNGPSEKPIFLEFRSSKIFIMFVVVFAVFTVRSVVDFGSDRLKLTWNRIFFFTVLYVPSFFQ